MGRGRRVRLQLRRPECGQHSVLPHDEEPRQPCVLPNVPLQHTLPPLPRPHLLLPLRGTARDCAARTSANKNASAQSSRLHVPPPLLPCTRRAQKRPRRAHQRAPARGSRGRGAPPPQRAQSGHLWGHPCQLSMGRGRPPPIREPHRGSDQDLPRQPDGSWWIHPSSLQTLETPLVGAECGPARHPRNAREDPWTSPPPPLVRLVSRIRLPTPLAVVPERRM